VIPETEEELRISKRAGSSSLSLPPVARITDPFNGT